MANSIANLRLKAKEYSLNQVPTVNWEEWEGDEAPRVTREQGWGWGDARHLSRSESWCLHSVTSTCKLLEAEWRQEPPFFHPPECHCTPYIRAGCCSPLSAKCYCCDYETKSGGWVFCCNGDSRTAVDFSLWCWITHWMWDWKLFFHFKIHNKLTQTYDIYAISLKALILFFFHASFHVIPLTIHFVFHVIVQYKGEANVFLNSKTSTFFLISYDILNL